METVTAAEARRQFSALLRAVGCGQSVVVTLRGKPVATVEPMHRVGAAKQRLLRRLASVRAQGARTWARDELYEG